MAYRRGIHNVLLQTTASGTVPTALSSFTNLGQTLVEGIREESRSRATPIMGHTLGETVTGRVMAGYEMNIEFTLNEYKLAVSTVDPFLQWFNSLDYGDLGTNVGQLIDASLQRTLLLVPLFSVSGQDLQRIYFRIFPTQETVKRCLFNPIDIVRNPLSFECYPYYDTNTYRFAKDLSSPLT